MRTPALVLGALLVWAGWAGAEPVTTHDFFRLTQTVSRSASTPGAWRYTVAPRTKEARAYWEAALASWRRSLKIGLRVKLGAFELVRTEKGLRLLPLCAEVHPGCFSRPELPAGLQGWKMDLVLLDLHNNLDLALADARKHAKPYPATVTLSKFLRLTVHPDGRIEPAPYGWKP
ncbi:hypothetical protein Ocepr_2158 [Oceanithermus profundus DSM 14977]|uniref:Uncharacterized protein n=1 Tax=Oceanithermus profundus (strain DSM 14977 / NBRC 100410 / VKM B-2274 / 506) TaxID=670487 RepID=E4U5D4_OCEP5|nr:hypothetical protein [Oceanithermus profundus]ADR37608.1 hypothetical protein Ocepr_2158 [Oceanithermus profundus DSM 14977]